MTTQTIDLKDIKGRFTIVGFNSVGFPVSWDTNIQSVEQNGKDLVIIHKPKGKKQYLKHTFDKLNRTSIYKGWLKEDTSYLDFVSFDPECLGMFDKYEDKKVLSI